MEGHHKYFFYFSLAFFSSAIAFKKYSDYEILKRYKKEYFAENFIKSFPYSLSEENTIIAKKIITNLYNDSLVYTKSVDFLKEYNRILNSKNYETGRTQINNLISKYAKELYSIDGVKERFDSLYKVFSTNKYFVHDYKEGYITKKLHENKLFFIDRHLWIKPKKIYRPQEIGNQIDGFRTMYKKNIVPSNVPLSSKKSEIKKRIKRR